MSSRNTATADETKNAENQQQRGDWLRHRRNIGSRPLLTLLVATVPKGNHEVTRVEHAVGIPVTFRPAYILSRLVRAGNKDLHEVAAVEFTVEVGVAVPGAQGP